VLRLRRKTGDGRQGEANRQQAIPDYARPTHASPYIYGAEPPIMSGAPSHMIFNRFLWLAKR
jgi:hypothetical protein